MIARTEEALNKLQNIESTVLRKLVSVPSCIAQKPVKDDQDYSIFVERDMKDKLSYTNCFTSSS